MTRKKILIHSIVFSPDGVSTAYLFNDIALKFKSEGYEVVVLTTTPHYNVLPDELAKQPLKNKFLGLVYESDYHGIRVLHITQKKFKSSLLRIIGFAFWHFFSFIVGLSQRNISVILSPSPPLTIGLINLLIGWIKGAKVIYNVQEIYPDFLVNQGQLRFRPIISLLKWMEKTVYNRSDATTTIDKVFYDTIVDRFKDRSKLQIIPNFVDTSLYKPLPGDLTALDKKYFPDQHGVMKVMYAGNIGHAQAWQPLLDLAEAMSGRNVEFWVIGEGVMKGFIEEQIASRNISNIHMVPYQPRDLMPTLIAYSDLQFIFMSKEMEGQGFPSKVYTILACGKPLLVISGRETPIYNFLEPIGCACLITEEERKNQVLLMTEFIESVREDRQKLSEMGLKGLDVIKSRYTKEKVSEKYVQLSNSLIN